MKKYWVDPPSGWKYGFPKVWDSIENHNVNEWMIDNGYPEKMIESMGDSFYCRMWEYQEDE